MELIARDAGTAAEQAAESVRKKRPLGRPSRSNEELLEVALDLFLANGYEQTSLEAITTAAGMAKRTVYARYGDKETLFRAALRRAIDEWLVPVERLREAETPDLEETLLRIGQILLANIMSPAGLRLLRLTNAVASRMPDIAADNVRRGTEPTEAFLADLFTRRIAGGSETMLRSADAATAFLHLVVGGPSSMAAWGVGFDQEALDRHAQNAVKLFLHGLLPRGSDCPAEKQNQTLRRLLTDALLENAALKDALRAAEQGQMRQR